MIDLKKICKHPKEVRTDGGPKIKIEEEAKSLIDNSIGAA
jgi:hypothetical protein